MPPRNLFCILLVSVASLACHVRAERIYQAGPLVDAFSLVDRYYVDKVEQDKLVEAAMRGLTSQLDPYTAYIPPGAYENFQDALQQEFAGIGVLVEQPEATKPVRVITPLVGSPAIRAGFLPGDEILVVGGRSTEGLRLEDVSKLLRGPIGSSVSVVVGRSSGEVTLEVERANILLESVQGDHRDAENRWVYRLTNHPEVAYIRLTSFGERTPQELDTVLRELDNRFQGLILDLRGNTGGLLGSAVDVCDMFLNSGVIVSTRGRGVLDPAVTDLTSIEDGSWSAQPGTLVDPRRPLVVLVDRDSASASEVVAACLKDHGRAIIVGERTFGKGSVQNVFPLESGRSALKLTTARYYRPNGHNIHRSPKDTEEDEWGVRPTEGYEVPLSDEQRAAVVLRWELVTYPSMTRSDPEIAQALEAGEQADPHLDRALDAILGGNRGSDVID